MQSDAESVEEYLAQLPDDRRAAITKVRDTVRANVPDGIVETMRWGMIAYEIPLERYPDTYNGQPIGYAAIASQKNHMAVYLTGLYMDDDLRDEFLDAYRATGKRLDVGKSCVRFRKIEDLPLELIGEAVGRFDGVESFVETYDAARKR